MTYQPYPTSGSEQLPQQQRPAAPPSISNAVKLMYVGAGLSALEFVVGLATVGSLKQDIIKASTKHLTATQLHTAQVVGIATIVILGLIGIGLWIWMARANGAGKSWARNVAGVLFALNTLGLLSAVDTAIQSVRGGGTISMLGVPSAVLGDFPYMQVWMKALTFRAGWCNVQAYMRPLLDLIAAGRLKPDSIISHRMKLEDAEEAYRIFDAREATKIVLTP